MVPPTRSDERTLQRPRAPADSASKVVPTIMVTDTPPSPRSSADQDAPFDDDAWERELDEVSLMVAGQIRRAEEQEAAEARPAKRTKTSKTMPGGPSSSLNPRSSGDDRKGGMFSLVNIRGFMAEHHAEWKAKQVPDQKPAPRRWRPRGRGTSGTTTAGPRPSPPRVGSPIGGERRSSGTGSHGRAQGWPLSDPGSSKEIAPPGIADASVPPDALTGAIGRLASAGDWVAVCDRLFGRDTGAFVSGGPGVGKSTFLKRLHAFLTSRFAADGEVVVLAPTGTSAKTAGGMTYHSFFGFGREYKPVHSDAAQEAARLLSTRRFQPIKERLCRVRAVLLDEVSLVNAASLEVMCHLLQQARPHPAPPSLWFAFGDFLQLRPVFGAFAFTAKTWVSMFGDGLLELTTTYRQRDPGYIRAIQDARLGVCSDQVIQLVKDCAADQAKYDTVKSTVMHLMPLHKDVIKHNRSCLELLCGEERPIVSVAVDSVAIDIDRDMLLPRPVLDSVSVGSRSAALSDCVAPKIVSHCVNARVLMTSNRMKHLGICHGSAGCITAYDDGGAPVVRFEDHPPPARIERGQSGLLDCGDTWIDVACPPVEFTARLYSTPGAVG